LSNREIMKKLGFFFLLLLLCSPVQTDAQQHSVAHDLSEQLLNAIRNDFARPTVHARNLFHCSAAMYDAWSAYDTTRVSEPYFLDQTNDGITCLLLDFPIPDEIESAREEAMSFAVYRIMLHRFSGAPGYNTILGSLNAFMSTQGYDVSNDSANYLSGEPSALGNYIAGCIINYGMQDNARESLQYGNTHYSPINEPLIMAFPGNQDILDYNRWQPLTLNVFIDQSGNVIPFNTPDFLSAEWGDVFPFAINPEDYLSFYERNGNTYSVYHDPGPPPYLDTMEVGGMSDEYKWGFSLVSKWSSHMDTDDGVMWDISPASIGNVQDYPTTIEDLRDFYDPNEGGDPSIGHTVNPKTGLPYEPQIVPRGDYARVLAEFWADGPESETPPGHWFAIINTVMDHPDFEFKYNGKGEEMNLLEYQVKAYFTLGGAMHDSAISAWSNKGWYDYIRPVSAIRAMTDLGQSTDASLPSYHTGGIPLDPGFVELVEVGDPLAGFQDEHVGKIKLMAWRGPDFLGPPTNIAHVGWILAEEWYPYQRPTFVTPNFAGYVSGHSTFSRAAAEVLTNLTGDPFFPGGMGVFSAPMNDFLVFEEGPSMDIELQWATYRDASDQCSLSRIWGGIHPPADDIPGRLMGITIGTDAFNFAKEYFYNDNDNDGYYSFEDCDDTNPDVNPGSTELCDNIDNNCVGGVDEDLPQFTYYQDLDGDGFGEITQELITCESTPPTGFVADNTDCDDAEAESNPSREEVCDGIDNDCNGMIDDGLEIFRYYLDADADDFGNEFIFIDTCLMSPPLGYVAQAEDCDDNDNQLNPNIAEVCDGIDNDCNGMIDDGLQIFRYYADLDADSFGDATSFIDTCQSTPPPGYVTDFRDCDDENDQLNPTIAEVCDGIDNDCNGMIDDGLQLYRYYYDWDNDGYGEDINFADTCITFPPDGYVDNALDCDDYDADINPDMLERCDGIDNDCNGFTDDGLELFTYFRDSDEDAFGNPDMPFDTCLAVPPLGFVVDNTDCNDQSNGVNPISVEISDNGIDEDCTGVDYFKETKIFPNPVYNTMTVHHEVEGLVQVYIIAMNGKLSKEIQKEFVDNRTVINVEELPHGVYMIRFVDIDDNDYFYSRFVKSE